MRRGIQLILWYHWWGEWVWRAFIGLLGQFPISSSSIIILCFFNIPCYYHRVDTSILFSCTVCCAFSSPFSLTFINCVACLQVWFSRMALSQGHMDDTVVSLLQLICLARCCWVALVGLLSQFLVSSLFIICVCNFSVPYHCPRADAAISTLFFFYTGCYAFYSPNSLVFINHAACPRFDLIYLVVGYFLTLQWHGKYSFLRWDELCILSGVHLLFRAVRGRGHMEMHFLGPLTFDFLR